MGVGLGITLAIKTGLPLPHHAQHLVVEEHQMWAAQYLRHAKSRGFITSGGLGTMGFGYGAAIGVLSK